MKKPTLLIGLGSKPSKDDESEDLGQSEKHAAASALRSALKGGNPDEIVDAFESMLEACSSDEPADDDMSEDAEESDDY